MGSNLYTGGIFVDGSLKNTPLHRLFYSTVPTSTQAERSFRKMAARLLHGRLLFTFQTLIKIEIFFQSRPLHRRSIHAEFKPLHRLNEVSKKWQSVSFTDAFVHCPDFGSKSKFYRSRPSPHNLWETRVGDRLTNTFTKDFCVRITNTFKKDFLCLDNEDILGGDEVDTPEIMDEILTTARDLELEVNEDDIEDLIMGHEDELTIEELQEILNEEHQETQRNVSLSEQEEDERGPMPTSAIKDLLKKGEALRAVVL
ncbi:hypothetical protein TNCV_4459581 [Trichonephila clavipes]|nr:hypothetical protein TNCV_4459581 [Trichonephila clavipes]